MKNIMIIYMNDEKYILKIITMGDANSGKTLLCNRICNSAADRGYMPTIGVEFSSTDLEINDLNIKLQLWDTAGQECFAPIVRSYYKNIVGIFFIIDLTSQNSIKNIDFWLDEFNSNRVPDCETIVLALGNKIDCDDRIISYEDISDIFKKKNIDYMEISAKNKDNVEKSKLFLINKILNTFDIDNHPGIRTRDLSKSIIVKSRNTCNYLNNENPTCCPVS